MLAKKPFNPFYLLLVVVGTAFAITACAYMVMAVGSLRPENHAAETAKPKHEMMTWMNKNGEKLLLGELLILAVATVGAISTDDYWTRRALPSSPNSLTDPTQEHELP